MTSILGKLGTHAANMRSGFLSVCGLGCLTYAAYESLGAGAAFVAGGLSLLLIDFVRDKAIQSETAKR